jgi:serine/threonine-protein kinase
MLAGAAAPTYVLEREIGSGGFGTIYAGTMHTPAGKRRVAIKRLLAQGELSPEASARLLAEGRLVFQLTHVNICQALDLGTSHEGAFVVLEYVEGLDLHRLLKALAAGGSSLDVASAIYIAREVARALDYAHRRTDDQGAALHLVHGDVTPRNVLLSLEGEIKLADFGIARAIRAAAPGNRLRGGTPGFMAPELLAGHADHRADVYSLGVTLYVALGGTNPQALEPERLRDRRSDVSRELIAIVSRATSVEPEKRYLSAAELERELAFQLAASYPQFTPQALGAIVRSHTASLPVDASASLARTLVLEATVSRTDETRFEKPPVADGVGRARTRKVDRGRSRTKLALAISLPLVAAAAVTGAVMWPPSMGAADLPMSSPERSQPAIASPTVPTPPPAPAQSPPVAVVEPSRPPPAAKPPPRVPVTSHVAPRKHEAPATPGLITVTAQPWGIVYVDGKRVADGTPAYRVPIAAGVHDVWVENPELGRKSPVRRVQVDADHTSAVGFRW